MQLARFSSTARLPTHTHLAKQRTRMASTASAAKTALDEMDKGEFKRTAAGFRLAPQQAVVLRAVAMRTHTHTFPARVSCPPRRHQVEPGGRFAPEADRYHLYISYACPWACRTVAAMHMKVCLARVAAGQCTGGAGTCRHAHAALFSELCCLEG